MVDFANDELSGPKKRVEIEHEIYTLLLMMLLRKFKQAHERSELDGTSLALLQDAWDVANDKFQDCYERICKTLRHVCL